MNPITRFLGEEWVHALAWTLLHSLWQGLLIALLLALAFTLLRHHRPQVRYGLALGAMALMLGSAVLTFVLLLEPAASTLTVVYGERSLESGVVLLERQAVAPGIGLPFGLDGFGPWMPLLALGWMLGVAGLTLRSLGEMLFLQHLRFQRSEPASARWQAKVDELASAFSLPATIELRRSLRIHTPMVLGFIKPIILMPAGLMTQLPPAELEMVLAHELAHIRRHDYLVNLLQTLVEILLFFNPAVWWVSSLVRAEREHCCDDAALDLLGDERGYVRTLGRMETYRQEHLVLAMSLLGPRGSVLGRMQRMLHGDQPTRVPTRLFWTLLVVATCGALLAFSPRPEPPIAEKAAVLWEQREDDTLPAQPHRHARELKSKLQALETERRELERELRERELDRRAVEQAFATVERNRRRLELQALEREQQLSLQQEALRQQELQRELELLNLQRQRLQLAYQQEQTKEEPDAEALADMEESMHDLRKAQIELKSEAGQIELDLERRRLEWAEEVHERTLDIMEEESAFQEERAEAETELVEIQRAMEDIQFRYQAVQQELQRMMRENPPQNPL